MRTQVLWGYISEDAHMAKYGYTLYCEGFDPRELVQQAVMAEQAGFDFLVISDHYHPWLSDQSHAGFAWSILGAVAQATSSIQLATMVTCPIVRYHPAIVAQMAATIAVLSNGRFTLGLGTGERLNEHVVGRGWPSANERRLMVAEAIEIIQGLWAGGYLFYDGAYFKVEDAQVYDLPEKPINMFLAAGGPESAVVAAESAGGVCMTEPKADIVRAYLDAQGDATNTWAQIVTSWDKDEQAGLQTAHKQFRFAAAGWKVQAELPNPVNFDAATKNVRPEDLAESIPAGPDASKHAEAMKQFLDIGIQNLAVAYPGSDTQGFMQFWQNELRPQLP